MSLSRLRFCALPVSIFLSGATAHAISYASRVISYTPGTANPTWSNPSASLGAASALTGENASASNYFGFPNILSPFSPAYQGDEIVQIGEGGQLTLGLSNFALVGAGKEIGVYTNVGLIDADYPNAVNTSPATRFGGGSANLSVSADNITWKSLGSITFDMPSLFFPNTSPYLTSPPPGPTFANFGLPMPSPFSCFDGQDWTNTQNCFQVSPNIWSAGGNWLDLSSTGLSQVGFIRFDIPVDANPINNVLSIDTIAINNADVGAAVPEPTTFILMPVAALLLARRRGC